MRLKLIGYVLAGSVMSTGAFAASTASTSDTSVSGAALSLAELCTHARLSTADQADCRTRVSAATTEIERLEVRRTFEAKAGLRAGSMSGTGLTTGTESEQAEDPVTAPAAKPIVD